MDTESLANTQNMFILGRPKVYNLSLREIAMQITAFGTLIKHLFTWNLEVSLDLPRYYSRKTSERESQSVNHRGVGAMFHNQSEYPTVIPAKDTC